VDDGIYNTQCHGHGDGVARDGNVRMGSVDGPDRDASPTSSFSFCATWSTNTKRKTVSQSIFDSLSMPGCHDFVLTLILFLFFPLFHGGCIALYEWIYG
jgi:hypothetical protein